MKGCIDWLTSQTITSRRGLCTGPVRTSSVGSQPVRRERAMVARRSIVAPPPRLVMRRVRRVGHRSRAVSSQAPTAASRSGSRASNGVSWRPANALGRRSGRGSPVLASSTRPLSAGSVIQGRPSPAEAFDVGVPLPGSRSGAEPSGLRRACGSTGRTASAKTAANTPSYLSRSCRCRTRVTRPSQYRRRRSGAGCTVSASVKVSVAVRSTDTPAPRSRSENATAKAARSTARNRTSSPDKEVDHHRRHDNPGGNRNHPPRRRSAREPHQVERFRLLRGRISWTRPCSVRSLGRGCALGRGRGRRCSHVARLVCSRLRRDRGYLGFRSERAGRQF